MRDDIFICFASFEERCKGFEISLKDYKANHCCILRIIDEPCEKREKLLQELMQLLNNVGQVSILETQHKDPIVGIIRLAEYIRNHVNRDCPRISIDITTFPRKHLFLVLKLIDKMGLWDGLRLYYTLPVKYLTDMIHPLSYGLGEIAIIPTFKGFYNPHEELKLILFLGYDGDRALALLEGIEPHKTMLVIPQPAFYPEWEGKTEELNRAILSQTDEGSVFYSDAQDPISTFKLLEKIICPRKEFNQGNWYIAPLGTKLQAVGVYYFLAKYPEAASVIYAALLRHNEDAFTEGIGKTFEVSKRGF
jgi:hypothetical protein